MTVADGGAFTARRIDRARAISEEASFFRSGSHRLFGVLHRPTAPAAGGLVVCPSIHAEFIAGYRIEVSLARALASRGIAVQRFHYYGTGHSGGEADETSFATMRADALAAAERLSKHAEVGGPAFLGTRFGALVAASAASEHPESSLLLVEPTLEARRFFRDAWRAVLIRDVKEGIAPSGPNRGPRGYARGRRHGRCPRLRDHPIALRQRSRPHGRHGTGRGSTASPARPARPGDLCSR